MIKISHHWAFIVPAILLVAVVWIAFPYYHNFIDPDGTSYLTIAHRYATHDYFKAINGYWSPWSCWLTAFLIKRGIADVPASIIINTFGTVGFLFISHSLFVRFNANKIQLWTMNTALSLFGVFVVYAQSFDDIWMCFFLLAALRLLLTHGFIVQPPLWIVMGAFGALAYFAKAYAFPFFVLNTVACVYLLTGRNKWQWIKISFVVLFTMFALSVPWILALNEKYGIWTTSTAGPLNLSWYLTGHPQWKPGIGPLLPPVYQDSPYYWEDPYLINGPTPFFWNSWHLLGLQIIRIGLHLWKLLLSSLALSVFFPVIGLISLLWWRSERVKAAFAGKSMVILRSFLLFPLGYLLINYESRYLWYMIPLAIVLMGMLLQEYGLAGTKKIWVVIAISFVVYPAWGMMKMYRVGDNDRKLAAALNEMGLRGTFTSVVKPGPESQSMERIAYFAKMPFFTCTDVKISNASLLAEMNRYQVSYLVVYDPTAHAQNLQQQQLKDENGVPYKSICKEIAGVPGALMVYMVNPGWRAIEGPYY